MALWTHSLLSLPPTSPIAPSQSPFAAPISSPKRACPFFSAYTHSLNLHTEMPKTPKFSSPAQIMLSNAVYLASPLHFSKTERQIYPHSKPASLTRSPISVSHIAILSVPRAKNLQVLSSFSYVHIKSIRKFSCLWLSVGVLFNHIDFCFLI